MLTTHISQRGELEPSECSETETNSDADISSHTSSFNTLPSHSLDPTLDPTLNTEKRKRNFNHDQNLYDANRIPQAEFPKDLSGSEEGTGSKAEKCHNCQRHGRKCDDYPPFRNRCTSCRKSKSRCRVQGVAKQPETEKCRACLNRQRKCDGSFPFETACTACIQNGTRCRVQEVEPLPRQALSETDKCFQCKRDNSSCYGIPPFELRRPRCEKYSYRCGAQETEPQSHSIPKDEKCAMCQSKARGCSRERPCKHCNRYNTMCRQEGTGTMVVYTKARWIAGSARIDR